jgi:hypothetical protein
MTSAWGHALVACIVGLTILTPSTNAYAVCAGDPNALTFHQMIKKNKTGERGMDTLILGKVVAIKDVKPGKGGDKIAKLAVAGSPVGYAPLVARIHFYKDPPGQVTEDQFVYHRHSFYVVVANRLKNGSFNDDMACGQTRKMKHDAFWNLVRFARQN